MSDDEEVPELLEVDDEQTTEKGADRPKIPITLLTGYLGAGKSTLLNYILTAEHGYRIAVCMNDFGDSTDIEARTLTLSNPNAKDTPETQAMLSLPNGCLCCSFKDLGIAAIEDMVAAQPGKVDWVIVELTGVADPGPIATKFWANEEMGDLILDGVVCVVDSRNVMKQLDEDRDGDVNECQKQVACADVILLNKADLVSKEEMTEVEASVKALNPTLRVHHTTRSEIALSELFDIRAFSASKSAATALDDVHAGHSHGHHSNLTTIVVPLPTLSTKKLGQFESFLQSLLWDGRLPSGARAPEILRCKGAVGLEVGRAFVLQGVRDLYELKELEGQTVDSGKVVFIGRIDDGEALAESLRTSLDL